jgi:hypothetical protein
MESMEILNESFEHYTRVVLRINEDWRVIKCRHGIQWILQKMGGSHWEGRSYCRSKEALLRCIKEEGLGEYSELMALPEWAEKRRLRPLEAGEGEKSIEGVPWKPYSKKSRTANSKKCGGTVQDRYDRFKLGKEADLSAIISALQEALKEKGSG